MNPRRKRNSSKVNLTVSVIFHGVLVMAAFFLAAREGMLGKKLKEITVTMAPKEKKPEPPKEKPVEPKVQPVKPVEPPKVAAAPAPAPKVQTTVAPPPVEAPTVAAAPAPAVLPAFEFSDGAREVQTVSDPNLVYKGLVEHALRSHWNRPEDINDEKYVAEIDLSVTPEGQVSGYRWLKGSGDTRWDNSVKAALATTKVLSRPPPKGFPASFRVRFDVETSRTEEIMQLSSR